VAEDSLAAAGNQGQPQRKGDEDSGVEILRASLDTLEETQVEMGHLGGLLLGQLAEPRVADVGPEKLSFCALWIPFRP